MSAICWGSQSSCIAKGKSKWRLVRRALVTVEQIIIYDIINYKVEKFLKSLWILIELLIERKHNQSKIIVNRIERHNAVPI